MFNPLRGWREALLYYPQFYWGLFTFNPFGVKKQTALSPPVGGDLKSYMRIDFQLLLTIGFKRRK